jgi:multidrug efflux pump subunit AcrA (membrane-fusion protein)
MQPQIDGNIVKMLVRSGDIVKAGQILMLIDPLKQKATVQSQQSTQAQKKALYDYNKIQVERQRKLYEAGVVSRDAYDQATQAYENSKADYEANAALTVTQKEQMFPLISAITSLPLRCSPPSMRSLISRPTSISPQDASARFAWDFP